MHINKEKPPDGRLFSKRILCVLYSGCSLIVDNSTLYCYDTIGQPLTALQLYSCRASITDKNAVRLFTEIIRPRDS